MSSYSHYGQQGTIETWYFMSCDNHLHNLHLQYLHEYWAVRAESLAV